jgi:hypothetical protein
MVGLRDFAEKNYLPRFPVGMEHMRGYRTSAGE